MPELPEVETVRTALQLALQGKTVSRLVHCAPKLRTRLDAKVVAAATEERTIRCVRRRGKISHLRVH